MVGVLTKDRRRVEVPKSRRTGTSSRVRSGNESTRAMHKSGDRDVYLVIDKLGVILRLAVAGEWCGTGVYVSGVAGSRVMW